MFLFRGSIAAVPRLGVCTHLREYYSMNCALYGSLISSIQEFRAHGDWNTGDGACEMEMVSICTVPSIVLAMVGPLAG